MQSEPSPSSSQAPNKHNPSNQPPLYGPAVHPLQLTGTVSPAAQLSLISRHLTMPYILDELSVNFPSGCDMLVQVYLLIALDPSISTSGLPPGNPLISPYSPVPYILGDNQTIDLRPDFYVPIRGTWIKAHLVNNDAAAHHITIYAALRELETRK